MRAPLGDAQRADLSRAAVRLDGLDRDGALLGLAVPREVEREAAWNPSHPPSSAPPAAAASPVSFVVPDQSRSTHGR